MKITIVLLFTIIVSAVVGNWSARYGFSKSSNDIFMPRPAEDQQLHRTLARLQTRIATLEKELAAQSRSRASVTPADTLTDQPNPLVAVAPVISEQATLETAGPPATTVAMPRRAPPRMIIANPTPEQNAQFEALNIQLDDPVYLETLNLKTFTEQESFRTLPAPLQMLLLNKAAKKFNDGKLSESVFLDQAASKFDN